MVMELGGELGWEIDYIYIYLDDDMKYGFRWGNGRAFVCML